MSTNRERNKFGLSRYIPEAVKKLVRRRCGFGFVICGSAIITYEHIEPPFAQAREHHPDRMTLLCGSHQLESSKGILSKETIQSANKNPICKIKGRSTHIFDLGGKKPKLLLGGNDFTDCGYQIEVDREILFAILPPEPRSSRWRLSARFKSADGAVLCEIIENELVLNPSSFDLQQTSTKFQVLSADKSVAVELEIRPPDAVLLNRYSLSTERGKITIGPQSTIDALYKLDHPDEPPRSVTKMMLTFENRNGGKTSFSSSKFVSPAGLIIGFDGDSIQLRGAS